MQRLMKSEETLLATLCQNFCQFKGGLTSTTLVGVDCPSFKVKIWIINNYNFIVISCNYFFTCSTNYIDIIRLIHF